MFPITVVCIVGFGAAVTCISTVGEENLNVYSDGSALAWPLRVNPACKALFDRD